MSSFINSFILLLIILFIVYQRKNGNKVITKKTIMYTVMIILFLQISYWGWLLVFMADGPVNERNWTIGIIVLAYLVLAAVFHVWRKKLKNA